MEKELWIGYTRISTDDKGQTMDQQKSYIESFAKISGAKILSFFDDQVSGCIDEREGLRKAINQAIANNAVLVVSRADRLTRNLNFALELIERPKLKIRCLDMPTEAMNNKIYCSITWGVAEQERKNTGLRVSAKMQEIKKHFHKANLLYAEGYSIDQILTLCPLAYNIIINGKYEAGLWRFGNPNTSTITNKEATQKHIKNADNNTYSKQAVEALKDFLKNHKIKRGILTEAANYLNENGYLTPRGTNRFTATTVKNLCKRFNIEIDPITYLQAASTIKTIEEEFIPTSTEDK